MMPAYAKASAFAICLRRSYGTIKSSGGQVRSASRKVRAGAMSRRVVIPPGLWRADDGMVYEGAVAVDVAAPLARLPHFERIGLQGK